MRPYGGAWVKHAEWINGVTPNFSWTFDEGETAGGHHAMRIPTTVGNGPGAYEDYWLYMDDWAMADSEADLPTYNDIPGAPRKYGAIAGGF